MILPDIKGAKREVAKAATHIASPYNEGFTCWEIKKELWELKFALDEALERLTKFSGEEAWLEEQRLDRALNRLGYNDG